VSAIRNLAPHHTIHFVGSADGLDADLIEGAGIQFDSFDRVHAGPLHGVSVVRMVTSLAKLALGLLQSLGLMLSKRPQVIFLTGGWVGLPIAVAGMLLRIPIVIFVPDIEPGLTLKVLGRFAKVITATTPDTHQFYAAKKQIEATGYPLRQEFMQATRKDGLQSFNLDPEKLTILVFGGSRGARSINTALLGQVESLLNTLPNIQILHIIGTLDWEPFQAEYAKLPPHIQSRYHIHDYVHDMGQAMAAADLVVSRAGASTLGEFPYFHLPSILIPYPYAWRYQRVNAEWLAERGAARVVDDETLTNTLSQHITELVQQADTRNAMQTAAQTLATANGAQNIAQVILKEVRQ